MPIRIVTAYTPDYDELAARLVMSADHFNVPITAVPFADRGSWAKNHMIKPEAILRVMQETGDDVLWLDADMYMHRWPQEWPAGDVLIHYEQPPLQEMFDFTQGCMVDNVAGLLCPWAGHVLFRDTDMTRGLLALWQRMCAQWAGRTTDEQCLHFALQMMRSGLSVGDFDPSFIVHRPVGRAHGKPPEWA